MYYDFENTVPARHITDSDCADSDKTDKKKEIICTIKYLIYLSGYDIIYFDWCASN